MDQYSIVQRVWLLRGMAKLYSGILVKRPATIRTRDLAVTEVITETKARKFGSYREITCWLKKARYHVEHDCFIIILKL